MFHMPFDAFVEELTVELYKEGFLILATTDVRKVLKDNLHLDVRKYEIISVIIPHLFNEMLALQPVPGIVLPWQITVLESHKGAVETLVVDPTILIAGNIGSASLQNLAEETDRRLAVVLDTLAHRCVSVPDGVV